MRALRTRRPADGARRITRLALLTAIALTIFMAEAQIPVPIPIPGVKLGLANIVTVYAVFALGPGDALRAVKMIQPKLVIPMHYNTFPPIVQDPDAFAAAVQAAGFQAKVLHPGKTLSL